MEEKEKRPQRKPRAKLVPVRVIPQPGRGEVALVEWRGAVTLRRALVPKSKIDADSRVDAETLEAGVPYGLPWGEVEILPITGDQLTDALRGVDVWTADDLFHNQQKALGVFMALSGIGLAALNEFASER